MGVVGHQPGVMHAGQLAQLADRPEIAVHAEDRLRQDQATSVSCAMRLQQVSAQRSTLLWSNRMTVAPERRAPSHMQAWQSRSARIRSSLPTKPG